MFPKRWFFRRSSQTAPPFDASAVLFWDIKPALTSLPNASDTQFVQSTQWYKVLAAAEDGQGAPLSASEIKAAGLQIAFVHSGAPQASDWHDMRVENRQEGRICAPAYIRVGPPDGDMGGSDCVKLGPGTYRRFVRVKATPHEVHQITTLIIEGPNP